MSDDNIPQVEILGKVAPPRLSAETIAYQQGLLNDPTFCRDHPQHAAMIRTSLDEALQATGYVPPPPDPRTPAQQLHDRTLGVLPREPSQYEIELPRGYEPAQGV